MQVSYSGFRGTSNPADIFDSLKVFRTSRGLFRQIHQSVASFDSQIRNQRQLR